MINARISLNENAQAATQSVLNEAIDAEAHVRGYLLTADERFLKSYLAAKSASNIKLDALQAVEFKQAEPIHRQHFAALDVQTKVLFQYLQQIIDARHLSDVVRSNMILHSEDQLDHLRSTVDQNVKAEQLLIQQLKQDALSVARVAYLIIFIGTLASLIIFQVVIYRLNFSVNQRERAEAKTKRMNQLYNLLSQCNQAIVRSTNQAELFQHICRDTVSIGGFRLAWIGLVDEVSARVLPIASFGEGQAFLEDIHISMDADSPYGRGPTGIAIHQNQPYWCQDFQHDPLTAPWHEDGARLGWAASASLPLQQNGMVIGAFVLYSGVVNAFDEKARKLLIEMAGDISFALDNFEREVSRQAAESLLVEQESQYHTLADSGSVLIWTADIDQKCDYFNQPWLKFTGHTLAQELGFGWAAGVHPEDVAPCLANYAAGFEQRESFSMIYRLLRCDGEYRWIQDDACPRYNAAGEFVGYIGYGLDITELKRGKDEIEAMLTAAKKSHHAMLSLLEDQRRVEEEVRHLNDELEEKVIARTAALERVSLEAEQANQAKSAFLANMSHEIRTPMNGVIGMIDVLQQSSLTATQMEMTNIIHDSALALLTIINDILDFSKIEAGKLQLDCLPFSVASQVEGSCETIDHLALNKSVELTLFVDPNIPSVLLGDAGRLRQILVNLVNNAIKFSSAQGRLGKVSVRAVLLDSPPDEHGRSPLLNPLPLAGEEANESLRDVKKILLEFKISDNGIGMDEETQARVFTSFTQADSSTTRVFGGSGLGLTISRQLANLMGSDIVVQSVLGQGSVFSMQLSFAQPADSQDIKPPELVMGLSCAVVGGVESLADDLAIYLTHAGARVEQMADLAAVKQWLDRCPPNLYVVVIDTESADSSQPQSLLHELRANTALDTRLVAIGRGLRREPRLEDNHLVLLDGNVLTRKVFLMAVAIAAGRAQPRDLFASEVKTGVEARSRAEAIQHDSLILVAEDNEINQKVIQQQMALLGRTVDIVSDGREALQRWQSGDYAMLLADLHMPAMDGYELTTAIREAEASTNKKSIPIIAFTANALKGEEARCLAIGMDDYLSKPVQLVTLKAMLEKWLPSSEPTVGAIVGASLSSRLPSEHPVGASFSSRKDTKNRAQETTSNSLTERFVQSLDGKALPPSENELSQEFQVQRVELSMQNEELRQVQADLSESRDRYADLYENAQVGYLVLSDQDLIIEANLTATKQLGQYRAKLLHRHFTLFVAPKDRDHWYLLFNSVIQHERAAVNLQLQRADGSRFHAHLDCRREQNGLAKPTLRVTITDLTEYLSPEPPVGAIFRSRESVKNRGQETTPTVGAKPVDVNVLKQLVGEDEKIIRDFLHDFQLNAAQIAIELRTACAANQTAAAGALAHKLKSSARSVGALALGERCAEMEKAGKAGDLAALTAWLPQFEQELSSVDDFLKAYLT